MSSSTFAIGYTLKTLIDRLQTKIAPYSADKQQGWYGEDGKIAMVAEDMLGDDWDEWNEQDENGQEGEILTPDEIESIKDEIKELQRLCDLANSISSNKKGDCLLSALHTGFQKMEELGANRKALIFTESTRTQLYLKQLLEENGYMGKIVLFNGSNNDETSRKIYKAWKERNIGTSAFTPSLSANKRQAIVDYFRDEAEIMIATEAASEGINLQFCSLIVNYDLPSKEEQKHLKETRVTYYNIGMPDEYEIEIRNDLLNVVDHLKTLQTQVEANEFGKDLVLDAPYFKALNVEEHLYKPLVFLAEKNTNGNRPYVDVVTGEPKLKVSPVALNLGEQNFVTSFREYCKVHQDDVLAGKQVYLLRNESKRGLGFFEANNFYPDFILWILDGEKQYITFIDPKGIRNLKGLEDDKIQLFKYLQTEVASQLGNAHLMLNSFIISNTPMEQVEFWLKNPFEKGEFQKNHVLFKDDKGYLETMVDMILQYM